MEAVEIQVLGMVQGVGFRYFTHRTAQELGIHGWVKNLPDGSVLVRAKAAPDLMATFRQRLAQGPRRSQVTELRETRLTEAEVPASDFQITY